MSGIQEQIGNTNKTAGPTSSGSNTDYIGFKFNNMHSSNFNIVRISDGNRYNDNLLPTISDKTAQNSGGDGTYFFESYYTQRQFNINFAFDSMTEQQLVDFQKWIGDKKIHDLIFDEAPYKAYRVKVTGSATIKYIPFAEGSTNRIYKGEGTIQFVAYDPYARSVKKFINNYGNLNKDEWALASGMKSSEEGYDIVSGKNIKLYNPGVKESDFIFKLKFIDGNIPAFTISITNQLEKQLKLGEINCKGPQEEVGIQINTKINLIEGITQDGEKTGTVYNSSIMGGDFFKVPLGESNMELSTTFKTSREPSIEYDYYYF